MLLARGALWRHATLGLTALPKPDRDDLLGARFNAEALRIDLLGGPASEEIGGGIHTAQPPFSAGPTPEREGWGVYSEDVQRSQSGTLAQGPKCSCCTKMAVLTVISVHVL